MSNRHLIAWTSGLVVTAALSAASARLQPAAPTDYTQEQRALAGTYEAFGTGADFRTLLLHPDLVRGVLPFASYVMADSTLSGRHRELLILRTAWLAGSDYLWAKHRSRALAAGLSTDEIARTREGATSGWEPFEGALLHAADELHGASFVSDDTWNILASRYSVYQLMDATFTVAEMTMLAETFNSAGVQLEPGWQDTLDSRRPPASGSRTHTPLPRPRIEPVVMAESSAQVRAMLDPSGTGRDVAAVYRTFGRHPALYVPRQILSEYIRTKTTLSPRIRELLILRIGWLCRSEYEWAAHAPAGRRAGLSDDQIRMLASPGYDGWDAFDATLVRAVDELFAVDTISDTTWSALDAQFDERQLLDLLITTGGYRMVSMALNTFGVAAEVNGEKFP